MAILKEEESQLSHAAKDQGWQLTTARNKNGDDKAVDGDN